jgi:sirohydrochlorin cobaltochelatase
MGGNAFGAAALLLCAHGRGAAAAPDHIPEVLAGTLRDRARFARVEACYLRGSPGLPEVLAGIAEAQVFLVPLLMAEGHTSGVVLPAALAEAGDRAARVVVTPPLGADPMLAALAARDVLAQCRARGWTPSETAVVIAGHGTLRHAGSARSAEAAARQVAASGNWGRVEAAFIEQQPAVETVLRDIAPGPCVVVGFFLDNGGHAAGDMPRIVAAAHPGAAYGGAIGAHPGVADIVLEIVTRAAGDGGDQGA